jgi:hypothetical protein
MRALNDFGGNMFGIPVSEILLRKCVRSTAALSLTLVVTALATPVLCAQDGAAGYLPLAQGKKWVLRNPKQNKPIELEVVGEENGEYHMRFTSPWNSADWKLTPRNGVVAMTGYGANGQTMPLPADTVFFDFVSNQGKSWSNQTGKLTVVNRGGTVNGNGKSYQDCITIRQEAGGSKFLYTFSAGVGFVQFGEGAGAFVLDEGASRMSSQAVATEADPPQSAGTRGSGGGFAHPAAPDRPARSRDSHAQQPLLGVTVTTFANEDDHPDNLMKRFDQSVQTGVTYISGAGKWTELEPGKGKYKLDSIDFQSHLAQNNGAKMSYTLRLIDTIHKAVPQDLMKKGWMDAEMQKRVLRLVDALAPVLRDRVQWFVFGNEIDGYFDRHPDEVRDFVRLYDLVAARLHEAVPGIKVASSVQFGGIDKLNGPLQAINDRVEFLMLTYYPMNGDFTVQDPDAPLRDLPRMKATANGRQVVLQEIGYPTGSANKSNEDLQARFFRNVFSEMRKDPQTFAAGNVFLMADLRDKFARDLAYYYGITGHEPFRMFLQTLGLFDGEGRPKKSWSVFQSELAR